MLSDLTMWVYGWWVHNKIFFMVKKTSTMGPTMVLTSTARRIPPVTGRHGGLKNLWWISLTWCVWKGIAPNNNLNMGKTMGKWCKKKKKRYFEVHLQQLQVLSIEMNEMNRVPSHENQVCAVLPWYPPKNHSNSMAPGTKSHMCHGQITCMGQF